MKFSEKSIFQELLDVFTFRAKIFQVQKIFTKKKIFFGWKCSETYPKNFEGWECLGGERESAYRYGKKIQLFNYIYCAEKHEHIIVERRGVEDCVAL